MSKSVEIPGDLALELERRGLDPVELLRQALGDDNRSAADVRALEIWREHVKPMVEGGESQVAIAAALNRAGVETARGRRWHKTTVARVIRRGRELEAAAPVDVAVKLEPVAVVEPEPDSSAVTDRDVEVLSLAVAAYLREHPAKPSDLPGRQHTRAVLEALPDLADVELDPEQRRELARVVEWYVETTADRAAAAWERAARTDDERADYALEVEHQGPHYKAAAELAAAAVKLGVEVTVEVPTLRPDPAALPVADLRGRLEPASRVTRRSLTGPGILVEAAKDMDAGDVVAVRPKGAASSIRVRIVEAGRGLVGQVVAGDLAVAMAGLDLTRGQQVRFRRSQAHKPRQG